MPLIAQASILDTIQKWFNYDEPQQVGATILFPTGGGTGIGTYNRGEMIFASTTALFYRLATGTEGQVIKMTSGIPAWGTDNAGSGGGAWSTSTNLIYTTDKVLTGGSATTTGGYQFEVIGSSLFDDVNIGGTLTYASSTNWDKGYAGYVIVNASSSKWDAAYNWYNGSSTTHNTWIGWLVSSSSNLNATYNWYNASSANINFAATEVLASSSRWDGTYSIVNASSSKWDASYAWYNSSSTAHNLWVSWLMSTSSNLNANYAWYSGSSTNINFAATEVLASSSKWDLTYSIVNASSSKWDSTYSLVNASSSKWDAAYGWGNHATYSYATTGSPITGFSGILGYDHGGTGTSTALANQYLWWGDGTGKLIQVSSSTFAGAGGGITSLNGLDGAAQTFATSNDTNVGLRIASAGTEHTFTPYWIGTLAADRFASSTHLTNAWAWYNASATTHNLAVSNVIASSSKWDATYSIVNASSSKWDLTYSLVNASSSNWDKGYAGYVIVNASSSKWDAAYGWYNSSSTNINLAATNVLASSSKWDLTYSYVNSSSTNWNAAHGWYAASSTNINFATTEVLASSSKWDLTYSIVNASSSKWDSTYSIVNASSSKWDLTYSLVNASSSKWDEAYSSRVNGGQATYMAKFSSATALATATLKFCFTLENASDTDDNVPIWTPDANITIRKQYCRTEGGTSVGITISDGTNAMESITCDSDGQADDGSLTNNTYSANERIEFDTGTVTGAVTWLNFCNYYSID